MGALNGIQWRVPLKTTDTLHCNGSKGWSKKSDGKLYMQLSGAACTFAQDAISPLWVHKRKKGTVIPVQVKSHHYIKCLCSY